MGIHDSTKTRVTPVFDHLFEVDNTGNSWIDKLLTLPSRHEPDWMAPKFGEVGPLEQFGWGTAERKLSAPRTLLRWLLTHADAQSPACWDTSANTTQKRRALLEDRDPKILAEARRELERPKLPARKWFIFEGPSSPDVFLQTRDLVIVIEGKRTEAGPTTKVSWMKGRLQMIRHMDSALEIADGRQVVGFFIVEGLPPNPLVPQVAGSKQARLALALKV